MKHWYRVSDPLVKQNHSGAPSSHLTFIHSLYSPLAILHCFSDCFYCCFLCFLLLTTCLFPSLGNKLHINEFDSRFFCFLESFSVRVRTKTFFLWLLILNENNKTKNEKKEGWGLRIHSPGTKLVSSNLSGCFSSGQDQIWVAWIKDTRLRRKSFWDLNENGAYPWYFRRIHKPLLSGLGERRGTP